VVVSKMYVSVLKKKESMNQISMSSSNEKIEEEKTGKQNEGGTNSFKKLLIWT